MNFKFSQMALGLVAASALFAQAPPSKVGVINIEQAMFSTKDGQKAIQDLQGRFDPRRKELEKKQGDIAALQDQFRKSSNTASEEQKGKLAREIDQKQKSLQRDQEDAQAEYQQELQKLNNELGSRIMQVIDKYSRDNNFTMILDVSSQQSPVLYFATGSDVTADIVKMYDANAPTMGTVPAGGAGAPAMPKPAGAKPTAPRPAGAKP